MVQQIIFKIATVSRGVARGVSYADRAMYTNSAHTKKIKGILIEPQMSDITLLKANLFTCVNGAR
jgi:hypothetical protein